MKVNVEVQLIQISMEALKKCQNRKEVLTFCQNCSNFKKNHTCPEFTFDIDDYLRPYANVCLVMTSIKTASFIGKIEQLKKNRYTSQVLNNYSRDYPNKEISWEEAFSMYLFNRVKDDVSSRLIAIESKRDMVLSIPPGSCTRCTICNRVLGSSCIVAENLRYSLEALGFKVSDIYEKFFNKSLDWTTSGLPKTFDTCSALLSKIELPSDILTSELDNISVTL